MRNFLHFGGGGGDLEWPKTHFESYWENYTLGWVGGSGVGQITQKKQKKPCL